MKEARIAERKEAKLRVLCGSRGGHMWSYVGIRLGPQELELLSK